LTIVGEQQDLQAILEGILMHPFDGSNFGGHLVVRNSISREKKKAGKKSTVAKKRTHKNASDRSVGRSGGRRGRFGESCWLDE
jgi:hypothetical protein